MGNPNPSPETRFKPGVSGNPEGKPKGTLSLTNMLREALAEIPEGKGKKTNSRLLVEKTLEKAIKKGDVSMIRYCYDRLEGMPSQKQENIHKFESLNDEDLKKSIVEDLTEIL